MEKAIRKLIQDKAYIRNQIKSGKPIDSSKLKAGKIANIKL